MLLILFLSHPNNSSITIIAYDVHALATNVSSRNPLLVEHCHRPDRRSSATADEQRQTDKDEPLAD